MKNDFGIIVRDEHEILDKLMTWMVSSGKTVTVQSSRDVITPRVVSCLRQFVFNDNIEYLEFPIQSPEFEVLITSRAKRVIDLSKPETYEDIILYYSL